MGRSRETLANLVGRYEYELKVALANLDDLAMDEGAEAVMKRMARAKYLYGMLQFTKKMIRERRYE